MNNVKVFNLQVFNICLSKQILLVFSPHTLLTYISLHRHLEAAVGVHSVPFCARLSLLSTDNPHSYQMFFTFLSYGTDIFSFKTWKQIQNRTHSSKLLHAKVSNSYLCCLLFVVFCRCRALA